MQTFQIEIEKVWDRLAWKIVIVSVFLVTICIEIFPTSTSLPLKNVQKRKKYILSIWKTRIPSSSLRGNSYSDSSSVSSNQSPARPIKGQLMRQGAFDELASFSGQSSCSDELIVCNSTNLTTSMNTKAKRKVLFKSIKVSVTRN